MNLKEFRMARLEEKRLSIMKERLSEFHAKERTLEFPSLEKAIETLERMKAMSEEPVNGSTH